MRQTNKRSFLAQIKFLFVLFLLLLQQTEGKEDESYDDAMNVNCSKNAAETSSNERENPDTLRARANVPLRLFWSNINSRT